MDIAIPLFEGITALDAIGPYEVLSRLPGARVRFVAVTAGPHRTHNPQLTLMAGEPLSAGPHTRGGLGPGGLGAQIAGDGAGQAIQLGIEYDPQPPFRAGSPATAPAHIVEGLRARMRARMERDDAAASRTA